jgi:broad specificity polyphosphatase/5'/3'-nucleotidase SurE
MTSPQANSLDDIFGSSPPHEHEKPFQQPSSQAPEPSDLPSLRRQHVTAGYRDGVSAAKGEHVQHGFDAGFPVGAQLGMRAGTVIGIIEGLLRGFESRAASRAVKKPLQRKEGPSSSTGEGAEAEADEAARQAKREQLLRLYQKAVKELEVRSVFAGLENTFASEEGSTRNSEGQEKPEVVLRRKGDAVISQWEERARVARWEENMAALEPKEDEQRASTPTEQK